MKPIIINRSWRLYMWALKKTISSMFWNLRIIVSFQCLLAYNIWFNCFSKEMLSAIFLVIFYFRVTNTTLEFVAGRSFTQILCFDTGINCAFMLISVFISAILTQATDNKPIAPYHINHNLYLGRTMILAGYICFCTML